MVSVYIRFLVGGILLASGVGKIIEAPERTLYYDWVGSIPIAHYAFCLLEIALALWIIVERRSSASLVMVLLAFSVFTGIVWGESRRPHPRPCGCFGRFTRVSAVERNLSFHLLLNLTVMTACSWAIFSSESTSNKTSGIPSSSSLRQDAT